MSDWQTELAANLHSFITDLENSVEHLPDAEAVELAQADAAMLRRVEAVLRSPPAVRVTGEMVEAACKEWCDRHMPFGNLNALRRSMEHALTAGLAVSFPIQQDERRPALFQQGPFTLHGGAKSAWKIDCDALTDGDWATLAEIASATLPRVGSIVPIPRGGVKFAEALARKAQRDVDSQRLIVDDILTTGGSMIAAMDRPDDIGLVVFARGPLPPRVTALFSMGNPIQQDADDIGQQEPGADR